MSNQSRLNHAAFRARGGSRPPDSDFVKLIGEVVSVEQGLIPFTSRAGKGTIKVNEVGYAEPYRGVTGCATTLTYTI